MREWERKDGEKEEGGEKGRISEREGMTAHLPAITLAHWREIRFASVRRSITVTGAKKRHPFFAHHSRSGRLCRDTYCWCGEEGEECQDAEGRAPQPHKVAPCSSPRCNAGINLLEPGETHHPSFFKPMRSSSSASIFTERNPRHCHFHSRPGRFGPDIV